MLRSRAGQRGVIIILLSTLLGSVLFTLVASTSLRQSNPGNPTLDTLSALNRAREVLIARAVKGRRDDYSKSDEPQIRPGSLPCPDIDDDGSADGSNCFNYVGRFPYKTLETDDLRDSAGERLWYVLSPNFRPADYPTSNTVGQLRLTGDRVHEEVIALLIAPGQVLGDQVRGCRDRGAGESECDALRVKNYLEGLNAHRFNALSPSDDEAQFEAWPLTSKRTDTFNDTVLPITWDMLMPLVERRIGREARRCIENFAGTSSAPYPAPSTGVSVTVASARFGHFPAASAFPATQTLCRGEPPYQYFAKWRPLIFYALSSDSEQLWVNGLHRVDAVVMVPGRPLAGQSLANRLSSPVASAEFLESHPHDPSAHNWQAVPHAPDDHYAVARPVLTGMRQFNDTVECIAPSSSNPCTP